MSASLGASMQRIRVPELPLADFIAYGAGPGLVVVQQIQVGPS